ncbi:MAG: hypothetical protein J6N76_06325, partial [Lachnospiraceae bacterium]|nr:hypothetical protein [Lachnospiraceae bacterium]
KSFKKIRAAVKDFFSGINIGSWSASTKALAAVSGVTVIVLLVTVGVLIYDALSSELKKDVSAAVDETELAEADEAGLTEASPEGLSEVVIEEQLVLDIPTFVSCRVSGESIEKDLTIYIKGNESGKKISGTKFEIKLIDPEDGESLRSYIDNIKGIDEKIAAARADYSFDNPSGEIIDRNDPRVSSRADTISAAANDVDIKKAKDYIELTVGEKLLYEKESAIEQYDMALSGLKGESFIDMDGDGMIYIQSIAAGDYIACFVPVSDYEATEYLTEVNVKDKVEYKKVENIADKTVSAAEAGDVRPVEITPVEATLADTVEYVNASKELVSGGVTRVSPAVLSPATSGSNTGKADYNITSKADSGGILFASDKGDCNNGGAEAIPLASINLGSTAIGVVEGGSTSVTASPDAGVTLISANSSDTSVASAALSGNVISITGIKAGSATITVNGTETITAEEQITGADPSETRVEAVTKTENISATIAVTVSAAASSQNASFTLSADNLALKMGTSGSVTASGTGIAGYTAVSSNTAVATAFVSGSTITINPLAVGSAEITVSGVAATGYGTPVSRTVMVIITAAENKGTGTIVVPANAIVYAKSGINTIVVTPSCTNTSISTVVSS